MIVVCDGVSNATDSDVRPRRARARDVLAGAADAPSSTPTGRIEYWNGSAMPRQAAQPLR